ncbi:MAG: branched-chain amino acid transaminase [Gemmatimonadetes bacterium]|nr:branched-chain amino acid transaminase [Gemmatimonadota bacterium]
MAGKSPQTSWIWNDGKFVAWEDAKLHVMSHVVHYGTSIFEGIRCYATPDGPAIFRLDAHMRRFHDSAQIYRMPLPYDQAALSAACGALVRRNEIDECYIRPIALRGVGTYGLDPTHSPVQTFIICWPWGTYLGDGALEAGVDVCVSSWQRAHPNTFPALAKAGGNYINAALIKMEAVADGYAEAIVLNSSGTVSEGSGQNLFLVREGVLITPAVDGSQLPGITRDSVLTIASDLGIPVREQAVPREALYIADELFFCGTAAEVTPIRSVDRITIGKGSAGPISLAMQKRFLDIVHGRTDDRHGWLTPVARGAKAAVG